MTESIKIFFFLSFLIIVSYVLFSTVLSVVINKDDIKRYTIAMLSVTAFACFSPGFWIFVAVLVFFLVMFINKSIDNRINYFFVLVFCLPNLWQEVPGIWGIRYFIELSYPRLLILLLLAPILLYRRGTPSPVYRRIDMFVISIVLLQTLLGFRDVTLTAAIRNGILLTIDILVPYFVISRYVITLDKYKTVLTILLFIILSISVISIFEFIKKWHLYNSILDSLGVMNSHSIYLIRAGMLRASAIFYSPIELGLVMCMGFGLYLFLYKHICITKKHYLIPVFLITGLFVSLSRGPWLGFMILLFTYSYLKRSVIKDFVLFMSMFIVMLPVLSMTNLWKTFISLLPFIGDVESENISYREKLLDVSLSVFMKHPLFGDFNYRDDPDMSILIQGQGIVDVVNSYVNILLSYGIFALLMYTILFVYLLIIVYKQAKLIEPMNDEIGRLGYALVSIFLSLLFIISTVSSIDLIPYIIWITVALMAGYSRLAHDYLKTQHLNKASTSI